MIERMQVECLPFVFTARNLLLRRWSNCILTSGITFMLCFGFLIKFWDSSFSAFSAIFVFQTAVLANTYVSVHAASSLPRMRVWVFPAVMALGGLQELEASERTEQNSRVFSSLLWRICQNEAHLQLVMVNSLHTPENRTVDSQQASGEKSIQIQTEALIWVSLQGIRGFFPLFALYHDMLLLLSPKLCAV